MDLLGKVWSTHKDEALPAASRLDAAVVYPMKSPGAIQTSDSVPHWCLNSASMWHHFIQYQCHTTPHGS